MVKDSARGTDYSSNPTHTLMAFTEVTNAHGPSPQPTACWSRKYSLMTATGSNQALGKGYTYCAQEVLGGWWSNQLPINLGQLLHLYSLL